MQARLPHPATRETFARSKLDPAERERSPHAEALALHRDLLRLRREDPVVPRPAARRARRRGARPRGVRAPLVRRRTATTGCLLVNLGAELRLEVAPEPLLAPPTGRRWRVLWSSEDPRYGGGGTPEPETEEHNWRLPGHAAVVMAPEPTRSTTRTATGPARPEPTEPNA